MAEVMKEDDEKDGGEQIVIVEDKRDLTDQEGDHEEQ